MADPARVPGHPGPANARTVGTPSRRPETPEGRARVPTARTANAPAGQRGNAMVLFPAGVLVMLVLASIAVDTALLHRAQAELEQTAAGLANDAAAAVDPASLFDDDIEVALSSRRLSALADLHAARSDDLGASCTASVATIGAEPSARARCTGTATTLFRGVVGAADSTPITATASVLLRND